MPAETVEQLKEATASEQARRKTMTNVVPIKRDFLDVATLQSTTETGAPLVLGPKDGASIRDLAVKAMDRLSEVGAKIYQRGGVLVRPIEEPAFDARGTATKTVNLIEYDAAALKLLLMEHIQWQQNTRDGVRFVNPGWEIPHLIMKSRGSWPFPAVSGLISAPTLRSDGSLLQAEGYDRATGLLLVNPPPMALINQTPTKDEAERALVTLKELLVEFPFLDDASRSVALSLIISTLVRGALDQVPLHVLKAPAAGSGKSYLVDIASAIATGAKAAVVAATQSDDELEKRLVGEFIAGRTLISLDNLNGVLASNLLCQAVTQDTMSIRALGSSNVVRVANRSVIVANGNNIAIADDLARRTLMAQLDASVERPWERSFRQNPVAMVMADRGRYVAAALTVVLAWRASGSNEFRAPVNGFEIWSQYVRDPLVWLGEADPVTTMQAARDCDPKLQASVAMLAAMAEFFGACQDGARTMAQILESSTLSLASVMVFEPKRKQLREALLAVAGEGKEINTAKLGVWFRQTKGRIIGGFRLCSEMDRHLKVARWWVEQVEDH